MASVTPEEFKRRARMHTAFRNDISLEMIEAALSTCNNANQVARLLKCGRNVIMRVLKDNDYHSWEAFISKECGLNHKVRAVLPVILSEPISVYDLEVDTWSNFALCSGVFVHNSKDLADAWAGVCYYLTEFGKVGRLMPPSKGVVESSEFITRNTRTGGPQYIGNGDWRWPDEEKEIQEKQGPEDGLSSWIIS